MTAGDVIDRIKRNLGGPWRDTTYRDTFKFGGPDTEVRGIATTMFCSFEVIQRASAAGCNMIIPHEDIFWNDRDEVALVSDDPLYATKVDFMRKNNIVVFRIHDHMHSQRPDFTYVGSARELGLDPKYETAPGSHRFVIPETTLGALVTDVKARTGAFSKMRGRSQRQGQPYPKNRRRLCDACGQQRRKWMWSSAASCRRPTVRWTARNTCSTLSRSASTRVGSCSGTRSRKRQACSKWRSGSRDSSRRYRFNSSKRANRSGLRNDDRLTVHHLSFPRYYERGREKVMS